MTHPTVPVGLAPPAALDPVPHLLRDLVHDRLGIYFESGRFDMMLDKLRDRALLHGCRSYLDYYYILKYEEKGPEEWRRVMDCFSVQETYFWREADQIRTLVEGIVPEWFRRHDRPLRIWSAACATGEEPYTIAMALAEAGWSSAPIELVASDASEAALARARDGLFRERSFRTLPPELRAKYFRPQGEALAIDPRIAARVDFRWANLMDLKGAPGLGDFQVIFCRNVFIYFSGTAIRRVVSCFAERLPPGGHLFVGASESLVKLTGEFDLTEMGPSFVYRRKAT